MKKSTAFQLCLGVSFTFISLWIFLTPYKNGRWDFSVLSHLWKNLRLTPLWVVAAVMALTILTLWLRSLRWNLVLPKSPTASRRGLFELVMIGFMVNNILPARLGEAARILLLWKRNRFTLAQSAGSVLLERIIDTIVYLSFFFIPVLFISGLRPWIPYAVPMACCAAAAFLALLCYALFPKPSRTIGRTLLTLLPLRFRNKVLLIAKEVSSNLDWLFSPGKCLIIVLLSVCIIACYPAMLIVLVHDRSFGVLSGIFTAAWGAIGAAIPAAPGYVGTLHAALKQGLDLCGIEADKAIVVATLYHAIGFTTVTVAGLYYFFRLRISFREIGRAKEEIGREKSSAAIPAAKNKDGTP